MHWTENPSSKNICSTFLLWNISYKLYFTFYNSQSVIFLCLHSWLTTTGFVWAFSLVLVSVIFYLVLRVEIWMQEMIVATKHNLKYKSLFHESQEKHSNWIYEWLEFIRKKLRNFDWKFEEIIPLFLVEIQVEHFDLDLLQVLIL